MKNKIKYYRELRNISQIELAEHLNTTQTKISNIESGQIDVNPREIMILLKVLDCKFEDLFSQENIQNESLDTSHVLIKYTFDENRNHVDPDFTNLIYGDSGAKASSLRNTLKKDSYIFFHTNIDGKEYITAYFFAEKILDKNNKNEAIEIENLSSDAKIDEFVIIGDRKKSKILNSPLLLDKKLATNLHSLNIDNQYFEESKKSEFAALSDKLRPHRRLSLADINLLKEICKHRG